MLQVKINECRKMGSFGCERKRIVCSVNICCQHSELELCVSLVYLCVRVRKTNTSGGC